MTTLVLVHGRAQHGRDPEDLKRRWVAGLNRGLTLAGGDPVDPGRVVLPFFGDLLEAEKLRARTSGTSLDLESVRRNHIDPLMPTDIAELESALLKDMAEEAATQAGAELLETEGLGDRLLRLPGARRLAQFLADHTGVDQEVIENFLPDVAVYLLRAREAVLDLVRAAIPPDGDQLVVVAHSLGSAVALDLLADDAVRARTRLLFTAGSPLGLQAVHRNLKAKGPVHPGVPAWVTTWDPDDVVTLGHPLRRLWKDPLEDVRVDNPPGNAHSIEHYLGHEPVARPIARALAG
jgi:hypothetical protein